MGDMKQINARLDRDLARQLRERLANQEMTMQDWLTGAAIWYLASGTRFARITGTRFERARAMRRKKGFTVAVKSRGTPIARRYVLDRPT